MKKAFKTLTLIAVVAIALLAGGCKKDSSPSKTEYLTKSAWKYSSILYNGTEDIADCEKDDTETYSTSGTYTGSKGADDCSGSEDDYSGTWKLISNDSKIVYDNTDTADIQTLDGSTFRFVFTDDLSTVYILKH